MPSNEHVLNLHGPTRMVDAVRRACAWATDVQLAIAFTRHSGLSLILEPLREVRERGGRVRLLTSTYQQITQPEALRAVLQTGDIECRVQDGPTAFHAKMWCFDDSSQAECWVGSSNLTKGGLATNLEWNLRTRDRESITEAKRAYEDVWTRPDARILSDALIASYDDRYRAARTFERPLLLPFAAELTGPIPRPAQEETLNRLRELRSNGVRRSAVIAATGLGKTHIAAFDFAASGGKTLLYVSHRLEHLSQAQRIFSTIVDPNRPKGRVGGGAQDADADIVFTTIQSYGNNPRLLARNWDYIVIDEFHHAGAPSYQPLRDRLGNAFLLGLTATPERTDGIDILEWCNYNIAAEIRLTEAIDREWLLPFHYFGVSDETIDFARLPWRSRTAEAIEQIETSLSIRERAELIHQKALLYGFDGAKRSTVAFCASIAHARYMASIFAELEGSPLRVQCVFGSTQLADREAIYARFSDPQDPLQWLFVADILNEGVDIPAINSLLFLRPTESPTIFLQQLGRGLRLCEDSEVLTVLDFVGQHQASWNALEAINSDAGAGARVQVGQSIIRPPRACEIVLERRTAEILEKVQRIPRRDRKAECRTAYADLRAQSAEPLLPVDLWHHPSAPALADFRSAYGSWLGCQRAVDDLPAWAEALTDDHPAIAFLRVLERDSQEQRVTNYALLWGIAHSPDNISWGYEVFFERFPQWLPEKIELRKQEALEQLTKRIKLPVGTFEKQGLAMSIRAALGNELLREVAGRVLYHANSDYQERHGGVLRTPNDLQIHGLYSRPEIVRHFGMQFDPTQHNKGILPLGDELVIIAKADTGGAKREHQYDNALISPTQFSWTSQNQMSPDNKRGQLLLKRVADAELPHIFVQASSHKPACYLGRARIAKVLGSNPMRVDFHLQAPTPDDIFEALTAPR